MIKIYEQKKITLYEKNNEGFYDYILTADLDKNGKILNIEILDTILLDEYDTNRLITALNEIKKIKFDHSHGDFFPYPEKLEEHYKIHDNVENTK